MSVMTVHDCIGLQSVRQQLNSGDSKLSSLKIFFTVQEEIT
jgi:hypothetical protein